MSEQVDVIAHFEISNYEVFRIYEKGFFGRIWARIMFWIISLFSFGQND